MSPPSASLAAPKSDPISIATLSQHDGSDPNKPIYLAIKGTVFDVTAKKEMYGPGGSYNIFAGKDGSVGLGTSRLPSFFFPLLRSSIWLYLLLTESFGLHRQIVLEARRRDPGLQDPRAGRDEGLGSVVRFLLKGEPATA